MSIFVDETTKVVIQGISPTSQGLFHGLRNKAYGTKIVGGTNPKRGGEEIEGIAVYRLGGRCREGDRRDGIVHLGAAARRSRRHHGGGRGRHLVHRVHHRGHPGPGRGGGLQPVDRGVPRDATAGAELPGIISPGKCNIGITSGDIALAGGPVGIVSRSGTLTYQALHELSQQGVGQTTCVGIGGDPVPGTNFIDCLAAFEADPDTKAVMMIGEIGGSEEERAAEFIASRHDQARGGLHRRGHRAPGRKMGHAGAIISGSQGTAQAKMEALSAAGAQVAQNPTECGELMVAIVRELG